MEFGLQLGVTRGLQLIEAVVDGALDLADAPGAFELGRAHRVRKRIFKMLKIKFTIYQNALPCLFFECEFFASHCSHHGQQPRISGCFVVDELDHSSAGPGVATDQVAQTGRYFFHAFGLGQGLPVLSPAGTGLSDGDPLVQNVHEQVLVRVRANDSVFEQVKIESAFFCASKSLEISGHRAPSKI